MNPMYINSVSAVNPEFSWQEEDYKGELSGQRLTVLEPDYKVCIPDAGLRRRMSRIVKMGVAAALDCLSRVEKDRIGAIITATGLGCLADTEKFMDSILDNEERLLNPTAFIQSTFNTIGAQVALLCKNHHYNMTYVHQGFSFESALTDAQLMFDDEEVGQVLVGAIDELTETGFQIMERMGCWQNVKAGEGAHFFVLGDRPDRNCVGVIREVETYRGVLSPEEVNRKVLDFLGTLGISLDEVDLCLDGTDGGMNLFSSEARIAFKQYGGEYPTASAFAVWLGIQIFRKQFLKEGMKGQTNRILVYNNWYDKEHTLILLERMEWCG